MPTRLIVPLPAASRDTTGWGIAAVGADRSRRTGAGVKVAVLDTGIERDHPAFRGVDLVERDFTGKGSGDRQGHGTHCAGTIFGRDVGSARIGVARGVTHALIGKVLGDDGSGTSEMIFSALRWAMDAGADIVSMSLGFDFAGMVSQRVADGWPADLATSDALEAYRGNLRMFDALMAVLRANASFGASPLVVAAAGNESKRGVDKRYRIAASLPAAADGVLSVAAVGRHGAGYSVADFSNSLARVAAPGVDIRSAWPGGALATLSGTSMACPHVTGVATLWWEALRDQGTMPDAGNVLARLLASARKDAIAAADEGDIGQGLVMAPA
ncbi:S8 family peptidase [Methylobacterium sp. D54C]